MRRHLRFCLFCLTVASCVAAQGVSPSCTIDTIAKNGCTVTWYRPDGSFEVIHYSVFDTIDRKSSKNKREGEAIAYRPDSTIARRKTYHNDKLDGRTTWYYHSGEINTLVDFKKGKPKKVENYYRNGQLKRIEFYEGHWESLGGQCFDSLGVEVDFTPFRIDPQFVGGEEALGLYILSNLRQPPYAISGRCVTIVSFVIDKDDGHPKNVRVHTSSGYEFLDKQAVRVVKEMPAWIPGKQDGKPYSLKMMLPIKWLPSTKEEITKSKK